jgi:hypothetical protein
MTLITAREADRLCRNWIKIGETALALVEQLPKRGFSAFMPLMRFDESFCEGAAEHELYKQCVVEHAKEQLGRPWPIRANFEEPVSYYRSPLLLELEQQRDRENGVSGKDLRATYPNELWRTRLEPWARRQLQASLTRSAWFDAQVQPFEQERAALVLAEIRASGRAQELVNDLARYDEQHRYQCFLDVSKETLAPCGFKPDMRRGRASYPVLSKELTDEWDICWVVGDDPLFATVLDKGFVAPRIELRHRGLVTRVINKPEHQGKFLIVRYQDLVPRFASAYFQFTSLPILDHCIRAHLELYKLIGPTLEQAVVEWALR